MSFEAGDRLGSAVKSTVLGALADLAIEVGIVIVGPLCFRNPVSVGTIIGAGSESIELSAVSGGVLSMPLGALQASSEYL